MAEKRILISGDLTSDDKFKEAMEAIRDKGFIKTHRSGDTGIGKTLEDELGVEENSVQAADLGAVELKANRKNSNSKITLFTKSPDKRGANNKILRSKYGYKTEDSKELNPDSECYNDIGYTAAWDTTKASFWGNHKREISRIVKIGGKVITFGWNSGGIGYK